MMMAEVAAFDNVKELTGMAKELESFVQAAAADGTAAHTVEKGILQRVLAMGWQAMDQFFAMQGDGKGIPMRRTADQRPVGARRKKGEKSNKKQMATLGCVYTVDP